MLIERVKARDHWAFEAVFQRHVSAVYRQALRLTGSCEKAEEVVQEVFLTVYEQVRR